jgi:hypothetical protein
MDHKVTEWLGNMKIFVPCVHQRVTSEEVDFSFDKETWRKIKAGERIKDE